VTFKKKANAAALLTLGLMPHLQRLHAAIVRHKRYETHKFRDISGRPVNPAFRDSTLSAEHRYKRENVRSKQRPHRGVSCIHVL